MAGLHYDGINTPCAAIYSGVFAGSDGANFFFRSEQNRVLVGNLKDLESEPHPGDKVTFTAA